MKILNLTQHPATSEQLAEGVFEPVNKQEVQGHLTFTEAPTSEKLQDNAAILAQIAQEHEAEFAMIGGAPFFMSTLERALIEVGVTPLYAFSQRVVVETMSESGEVVKTAKFVHTGWVQV